MSELMPLPRIRGRLAQINEPEEPAIHNKWVYEIQLWNLEGTKQMCEPYGPYGPYDTDQLAAVAMKQAVREVCEIWQENALGGVTGEYFDLKNGGVVRKWDEH